MIPAQALPGSRAEKIQTRFDRWHLLFPQEKAYLHLDKDVYMLGDPIWFQAYLVEASLHLPSVISTVLYVDLVSPENRILNTLSLRVENGRAKGDFQIDRKWETGVYMIRAYTQYMRNFDPALIFSQEISIENPYEIFQGDERQEENSDKSFASDFAVQFFPEGGDFVEGLVSIVGVKAMDAQANGIALSGLIKNKAGEEVGRFQTGKFGLGSFPFKPDPNQKYVAEVEYKGQSQTIKLPKALDLGYVMQANMGDGEVSVTLQSNTEAGLTGGVLLGHIRGQIFVTLDELKGKAMRFKLPLSNLPSGVAHFTLFNAENLPVAERLVFIDNPGGELNLELQTDKEVYDMREKVTLIARLTDTSNVPQAVRVSVSVAEIPWSRQDADYATRNIRSYLLLDSELKGRIEDPDYFFETNEPDRKRLLDQLMMTQGWRRFIWQDILSDQDPDLRFNNEQGFTFSGNLTRPDMEKWELQGKVFLSSLDQQNFFMDQTLTNEEGKFLFSGYHFEDTTDILLQANRFKPEKKEKRKKKNKVSPDVGPDGNRNVDILLDRPGRPSVDRSNTFTIDRGRWADFIKEDVAWLKALEAEYIKYREYELEEIVIEGKRRKVPDPFDRPGKLYREPSSRLVVDSIKGGSQSISIFQLIRGRVPGVEIVGTPGIDQTARIRGNNSFTLSTTALILLDGVPISTLSANSINVQNVEFIDIIRDLATSAIYGEAGRSGIIAVYTRQGGGAFSARVHRGVVNIQHPGYSKVREFYAPVYEGPEASSQSSDFRTTLYWKPDVRLWINGTKDLEFFTGDRQSLYEVRVEGIDAEGQAISGRYQFEVKRE